MKDRNAWSLDLYLSKQIAEGCEKLRQFNHGHPFGITHEEWHEILLKIQKAFWKYHTREEKMTAKEEQTFLESDQWKEAWELFQQYFPHLWD
jgi:hypothetical protein